ncbi:DUF4329 domain-containing protein [Antarcticimicrobium luteum]|uniref:DUF4329 domain-containing protein n=1 Tax=Antarcticimicrobium luteum TaxID=2547397 RepID=A0A4R5USV5_9RHOB|nr:DUF4329 domain-containing protein [Antarcticimicrobium luteum]TDK42214.1 DUF4329 domain-containing protein [Antarcticimicrobium luteum]
MVPTLLLLLALSLEPLPAYTPPDPGEVAMLKARLAPIQHLSFVARYEYCGYLGRSADHRPGFTEIVRGHHNGCTPVMPGAGFDLIASLHTHGAYDPSVPAEFPTALDMRSDHAEGVNGYVATPGGRLWYIDSQAMLAVQICGPGCLPQDPGFHPGDDGAIAPVLSYGQLLALDAWE